MSFTIQDEYRLLHELILGKHEDLTVLVASKYLTVKEPRVPDSENMFFAQGYQDVEPTRHVTFKYPRKIEIDLPHSGITVK